MAMKIIKQHSKKTGLPPGTLLHVGDEKRQKAKVVLMEYTAEKFFEKTECYIQDFLQKIPQDTVTWYNIEGIHDVSLIETVGKELGLHQLTLEDIVHSGQRAKFEDFDDYLFIVLKMLRYNKEKHQLQSQQVSMVLGKGYLMTFQENDWDVFEIIRKRIRKNNGNVRQMGCDYLAYALIDAIVDHYYEILEHFGDMMDQLEEELLAHPTEKTLHKIHTIKRDFILLRKSIWPLREVAGALQKDESELLSNETQLHLRDVQDHAVQVIDALESSRDLVSGMLEIYLSAVSNKMNSIMKVLTLIATIFIPLTFVTGIFGMNFEKMPELKQTWMYPWGFWIIIAATVVGMVFYFRKRKWL
jgi:magnesium transporter